MNTQRATLVDKRFLKAIKEYERSLLVEKVHQSSMIRASETRGLVINRRTVKVGTLKISLMPSILSQEIQCIKEMLQRVLQLMRSACGVLREVAGSAKSKEMKRKSSFVTFRTKSKTQETSLLQCLSFQSERER